MYNTRRESFSDKRGGNRFGSPSFRQGHRDRGGFGGSRNREDRPSFEAICAECGNSCRVPFRPNGSKPVLCKMCFEGSPKESYKDRKPFRPEHPITRTLGDQTPKPSNGANLEARLVRIETKLDELLAKLAAQAVTTPANESAKENAEEKPVEKKKRTKAKKSE